MAHAHLGHERHQPERGRRQLELRYYEHLALALRPLALHVEELATSHRPRAKAAFGSLCASSVSVNAHRLLRVRRREGLRSRERHARVGIAVEFLLPTPQVSSHRFGDGHLAATEAKLRTSGPPGRVQPLPAPRVAGRRERQLTQERDVSLAIAEALLSYLRSQRRIT